VFYLLTLVLKTRNKPYTTTLAATKNEIMKKIIEYSSTRFYITQKVYEELILNPYSELIINTSPKKGNHPKGLYRLPNSVAKNFIESKQGTLNWDKNENFKQDSIPSELINYFK
jgi:hypothetical protein